MRSAAGSTGPRAHRFALQCWLTTRKRIAAHNTFTMLMTYEQVYSPVPDFCWMGEAGAYQTGWTLFSKEKFMQSSFAGLLS